MNKGSQLSLFLVIYNDYLGLVFEKKELSRVNSINR